MMRRCRQTLSSRPCGKELRTGSFLSHYDSLETGDRGGRNLKLHLNSETNGQLNTTKCMTTAPTHACMVCQVFFVPYQDLSQGMSVFMLSVFGQSGIFMKKCSGSFLGLQTFYTVLLLKLTNRFHSFSHFYNIIYYSNLHISLLSMK